MATLIHSIYTYSSLSKNLEQVQQPSKLREGDHGWNQMQLQTSPAYSLFKKVSQTTYRLQEFLNLNDNFSLIIPPDINCFTAKPTFKMYHHCGSDLCIAAYFKLRYCGHLLSCNV